MIDYVGDISKNDASVLSDWASQSFNIVDFGVGASSQVIAHYTKGTVVSIDTEPIWINKTLMHLKRLSIPEEKVRFMSYPQFWASIGTPTEQFDFVFDDGVDNLRRNFGMFIWPFIKKGGWLALHDQRRRHDWDNAQAIINEYWQEIGTVYYNHRDSNITFIEKRQIPAYYDNWQITENIDMSKW
jgi:hypothetical protein